MKKTVISQEELSVQSAFVRGEYETAQDILEKSGDRIRPVYRAIFEASAALASGDDAKAIEAISDGLRLDSRNYELYVVLAEYYAARNLQQTYLCYENALFYCDDMEDREQISLLLDELTNQGVFVPKAAVIVLSDHLPDVTKDCIRSIRETTPESAREIIVIDNAPTDSSVDWLKKQPDLKLLCNDKNKGLPAACNQGIGLAESDSDILLLHNDTVMTDNALFWLRMGLYENEQTGSTGSVTNHASNLQAVIEDGQSRNVYLEFAGRNNVPAANAYLNKLYLTGFALLLKRTVLDQVGLLDERFSPGGYEDNDICLRINLAGYYNVLCKNSFIIHRGGSFSGKEAWQYNNIAEINQRKFFEKWSELHLDQKNYFDSRSDIVSALKDECSLERGTVLVVGTGCGGILSCLQNMFPDAQIYGMEQDQHMAEIANRIADTIWVNLDEWKGGELAGAFDVMIINDALECTENPETVLAELAKMLKKEGQIFLSFTNRLHYSRMLKEDYIGKLLDRDRIFGMIFRAKLIECVSWTYALAACDGKGEYNYYSYDDSRENSLEDIIRRLQMLYPQTEREDFLADRWIMLLEKQRSDIQFNNKMAVCIPTYRRPEVVGDILFRCAELYKRYGLDVYYYDSSEDEETKKVVEEYQGKGYDNLYYLRIDPDPLMKKVRHIFKMDLIRKKYTYMWYLKDRCWYGESTLKLIYEAMKEQHDLIFLNVGHPESPCKISVCQDADEFYHRCGNYATSIDTTIYNVQSLLKSDFNVEDFCEQHDGEYFLSFFHFLIIFEQLAKKEKPDICLLAGRSVVPFGSEKISSGWNESRIHTWGKLWLEANQSLPDCYTNREDVIKRTTSFPWILGSLEVLAELHEKGILTPEYFEEIKGFWEQVSDIPLPILRKIAYGEYQTVTE